MTQKPANYYITKRDTITTRDNPSYRKPHYRNCPPHHPRHNRPRKYCHPDYIVEGLSDRYITPPRLPNPGQARGPPFGWVIHRGCRVAETSNPRRVGVVRYVQVDDRSQWWHGVPLPWPWSIVAFESIKAMRWDFSVISEDEGMNRDLGGGWRISIIRFELLEVSFIFSAVLCWSFHRNFLNNYTYNFYVWFLFLF